MNYQSNRLFCAILLRKAQQDPSSPKSDQLRELAADLREKHFWNHVESGAYWQDLFRCGRRPHTEGGDTDGDV